MQATSLFIQLNNPNLNDNERYKLIEINARLRSQLKHKIKPLRKKLDLEPRIEKLKKKGYEFSIDETDDRIKKNLRHNFFNAGDNISFNNEKKVEILESTFKRTIYKIKIFIDKLIYKTSKIWIAIKLMEPFRFSIRNYNQYTLHRIIANYQREYNYPPNRE